MCAEEQDQSCSFEQWFEFNVTLSFDQQLPLVGGGDARFDFGRKINLFTL